MDFMISSRTKAAAALVLVGLWLLTNVNKLASASILIAEREGGTRGNSKNKLKTTAEEQGQVEVKWNLLC